MNPVLVHYTYIPNNAPAPETQLSSIVWAPGMVIA